MVPPSIANGRSTTSAHPTRGVLRSDLTSSLVSPGLRVVQLFRLSETYPKRSAPTAAILVSVGAGHVTIEPTNVAGCRLGPSASSHRSTMPSWTAANAAMPPSASGSPRRRRYGRTSHRRAKRSHSARRRGPSPEFREHGLDQTLVLLSSIGLRGVADADGAHGGSHRSHDAWQCSTRCPSETDRTDSDTCHTSYRSASIPSLRYMLRTKRRWNPRVAAPRPMDVDSDSTRRRRGSP